MRELFSAMSRKGSFLRNISIFTGGSFVAYAVGFIFTPLITRIYSPEDYGFLAFFNTTLALCVAISTLGFTDALILPRKKEDFFRLAALVLGLSSMFAGLILTTYLIGGEYFTSYFNVRPLRYLFLLLPVSVVLNAIMQIADAWRVRAKLFSKNASAKITSVVAAKSSVTGLGLIFGSTPIGLIIGELVIRFTSITALLGASITGFFQKILNKMSAIDLRTIAREYRNYPRLLFPSSVLYQLSLYVPVLLIGRMYDSEFLGFYSLAVSLLGIPIQVIGFSMGKVFLQKANESFAKSGRVLVASQFKRFHYALLVISSLGYGIIYVAGPWIFTFIAGKQWVMSGQIASILSVALLFQLVGIGVSPVFRVLKEEKKQFLSNLWGSVIFMGVLLTSFLYLKPEPMDFIWLLAALIWLRQIFILSFAFYITGIGWGKHLVFTVMVSGGLLALFHILKMLLI